MKNLFWTLLACIPVLVFLSSPWGVAVLKFAGVKPLPDRRAADDGEYLDGEMLVAKCKRAVRAVVRDPSTIKWNGQKVWGKDGKAHAALDFTALNGLGGPVRETWLFTFDADGEFTSILTPKGEQLDTE
ncbi:hypothetical protein [Prosthecobacter sp.]|uniref:hypothetical protein n=1 Tax=Prosthecobacter sp. TaxID=1965333 RepID=UPI0037842E7A